MTGLSLLDTLPWEDVLYKGVFPYIPLEELFPLRRVSKQFNDCILHYLNSSLKLDFTRAHRITVNSFKLATDHNLVLRELNLTNARDWLTDSILQPLLKQSGQLMKLNLTNCTNLTDASIITLGVNCPNLCELMLKECHWLNSIALVHLSMNCGRITRLDLSGCWNADDEAVIALALSCTGLQFLSLAKIYGLTDDSVKQVAWNCRNLTHLNVQGCWRVTNDAIREIGLHCKNLTMLFVQDCRDITEVSLARLRGQGVRIDTMPPGKYRCNYLSLMALKKLNVPWSDD